MKKVKSFHLVPYRHNQQVESHENWAVLTLFLFGLLFWTI